MNVRGTESETTNQRNCQEIAREIANLVPMNSDRFGRLEPVDEEEDRRSFSPKNKRRFVPNDFRLEKKTKTKVLDEKTFFFIFAHRDREVFQRFFEPKRFSTDFRSATKLRPNSIAPDI